MPRLRVLLLNWRDLQHPEAGGAEKYLVTVAEGLAERGHEVVFRTAAYPGALSDEVVAGVRYLRHGGHYSIYPRAFAAHPRSILRRRRRRAERRALPVAARHAHSGRQPRPPRAPRAVAGRLRPAHRALRVVAGVAPRPARVPQHELRRRQRLDQARAGRPRGRRGADHDHPQRHGCRRRRERAALSRTPGRRPRPAGPPEARRAGPRRRRGAARAGARSCTSTSSAPGGGSPTCASTWRRSVSRTP